ncbi:hypothetical protein JZM24_06680 [Candidatus Sodalis endolongispinus]|uniref:Uncharacterized protein n=1 Tax=Candidatus Sodalis endolongispinus TaxID=2812662 RepID=A0ABS5YA89_9GAMM|nr:hypothetical protein [Candidatus Sodalis endolongispinus]MBT9431904.1 hypothetical protein [Candidatus Sodalis endolongispinus]
MKLPIMPRAGASATPRQGHIAVVVALRPSKRQVFAGVANDLSPGAFPRDIAMKNNYRDGAIISSECASVTRDQGRFFALVNSRYRGANRWVREKILSNYVVFPLHNIGRERG